MCARFTIYSSRHRAHDEWVGMVCFLFFIRFWHWKPLHPSLNRDSPSISIERAPIEGTWMPFDRYFDKIHNNTWHWRYFVSRLARARVQHFECPLRDCSPTCSHSSFIYYLDSTRNEHSQTKFGVIAVNLPHTHTLRAMAGASHVMDTGIHRSSSSRFYFFHHTELTIWKLLFSSVKSHTWTFSRIPIEKFEGVHCGLGVIGIWPNLARIHTMSDGAMHFTRTRTTTAQIASCGDVDTTGPTVRISSRPVDVLQRMYLNYIGMLYAHIRNPHHVTHFRHSLAGPTQFIQPIF